MKENFMDLYRAGNVIAEDIDDYVDRWHEGAGFGQELYEYLGMTEDEYAVWVQTAKLPCVSSVS